MLRQLAAPRGPQGGVQAAAEAGLQVCDLEPQQRRPARDQLGVAALLQEPLVLGDLGLAFELQQAAMVRGERGAVGHGAFFLPLIVIVIGSSSASTRKPSERRLPTRKRAL